MSTKKSISLPVSSQTVISDHSNSLFVDKRPTLTVDEFISQHSEIWAWLGSECLSPSDLGQRVTKELTLTPVRYDSILDPIALVRAFAGEFDKSHWAVTVTDDDIITGLYPINIEESVIDPDRPQKELFRTLLNADTTNAILFTVTDNDSLYFWDDHYNQEFLGLKEELQNIIDVEVFDYIVLTPYHNVSFHINLLHFYSHISEADNEPDEIWEIQDEIETHYVEFGMIPDSTFQVGY